MSEKNIYRPDGSANLDSAIDKFTANNEEVAIAAQKKKLTLGKKIAAGVATGLLALGIKQGAEAMTPVQPQEVPNRTPERTANQNPDFVEEGTNPEAEKQAAIAGMEAQESQAAALAEHKRQTEKAAAAEADKYRDILGIDKKGE